MKSARKVTTRRRARRSPPLSLSARIERLEKAVLFPTQPIAAALEQPRFTKLGSDGKPTTGDHFAILDSKTGLTWSAGPLEGGKEFTHADALKACTEFSLFGAKDWRAPTIEELLSIVDYTRHDPAVDTEYFKGPYAWTWSSTPYKGYAGYAWFVNLVNGYSFLSRQAGQVLVRAVRSGQQLGLLA